MRQWSLGRKREVILEGRKNPLQKALIWGLFQRLSLRSKSEPLWSFLAWPKREGAQSEWFLLPQAPLFFLESSGTHRTFEDPEGKGSTNWFSRNSGYTDSWLLTFTLAWGENWGVAPCPPGRSLKGRKTRAHTKLPWRLWDLSRYSLAPCTSPDFTHPKW